MSRETYIAEAPVSCRQILRRAFDGTASPRQAIKAKCLACVGFIRADVTNCTSSLCELHPYRPYQTPRGKQP